MCSSRQISVGLASQKYGDGTSSVCLNASNRSDSSAWAEPGKVKIFSLTLRAVILGTFIGFKQEISIG